MTFQRFSDRLFPSSQGEEIFGEVDRAQITRVDPVNKQLFITMMKDYLQYHEKNFRFYDDYEADKASLYRKRTLKWVYAFTGVLFAAAVVNPNFTSKRSFYLRKINCALWGSIFFAWGQKKEDYHTLNMSMRMNDYFPHEVKRALATKDYRYMALFNWENPDRKLFDDLTGKSLS